MAREPSAEPLRADRAAADAYLAHDDIYLFNEGSLFRLWDKLGAHPVTENGEVGTHFAVWAPNAEAVSVIGDFNGWQPGVNLLQPVMESGIWAGFTPGVGRGTLYKYDVRSRHGGRAQKADPLGFFHETAPKTASVVWDLEYEWNDHAWMRERGTRNRLDAPQAVYEVHVGSWMRVADEGNRSPSYRELAPKLVDYVSSLGFSHVEFLPVMEHPFFGSWGYQTTGYFAPTSRYGTPQDFMYLVDALHQANIGVILDWVPSHFPNDQHGLATFDGTHLYEHADPRKGFHPDWNSHIFNYGRNEVRSFLISSALFWLKKYHADGIRVDAVASMLYLDYSRASGQWIPNQYGGNENIEAVSFLRRLNEEVYTAFPDIQMIAEESTAWPMVSRPTYVGGLGFGLKWDMGWMHDTLKYFSRDPIHRKHHHNDLSFRMVYAFTENFVLPLSHDEVVHGKGSLLGKMPGDEWQKFANLRLLYAYMYAQPGKKLLFMGDEFGQKSEWNHDASVEWDLLNKPRHQGLRDLVRDLNRLYRETTALHALDCESAGFEWIVHNDAEQSTLGFIRKGRSDGEVIVAVFNFTPVPRHNYRIGVPKEGFWHEVLNTDSRDYGGSGQGSVRVVEASITTCHGHPYSLNVTLPPLGAVYFEPQSEEAR
jgi:1,4-alpha-glucan branching enzyme